MKTYKSLDGIKIIVGENAKENDEITLSSYPKEWWMHVDGGAGAHVIICHEEDTIPKETKRDAAVLTVHNSKTKYSKMTRVNLVRVDQVIQGKNHGQVYLDGDVMQLHIFMNKEKERLDRILKNIIV